MAADKSYVRLGVFVVLGVALVLATGLFFIHRMRSRAVIELVTYVTENVSGLDISSPVRFRGVSGGPRVGPPSRSSSAAARSRSTSRCSRTG